jgi:hypothetical protein
LVVAAIDNMHAEPKSGYVFEEDEWQSFEEALAPIDRVLKSVASEYGMHSQTHASKGWPGRTLGKRRLLKTYLLRISLHPGYVTSGLATWDIMDLWIYDYGELINKTISYRMLTASSDLKLQTTEPIIVSAVAAALS